MLILTIIGGIVCAFGMLTALSSERYRRIERIQTEMKLAEEDRIREENSIPVVGSLAVQEEPIPVR
jgi:hypothetical protein